MSCPGEINLLIHCFTTPEPFPYLDAPATREWIQGFLHDGILVQGDTPERFHVTEKGQAWLNMMLTTPYPEQEKVWIDPRTKEAI